MSLSSDRVGCWGRVKAGIMLGQSAAEAAVTGHSRTLNGFISRYETGLLKSIAQALPQRVAPDHLTLLGIGGALIAAAALIASRLDVAFLWIAVFGLSLNWVGDSLDGTLARLRRIERPRYGFFVDHLTDLASQFLIVAGLGLSSYMRIEFAMLALLGYLSLSVYTLIKLHVSRNMQITYFGVGPTEIRVLIGAGLILAATTELPEFSSPIGVLSIFDITAVMITMFAFACICFMSLRDGRHLAVIDPARPLRNQ